MDEIKIHKLETASKKDLQRIARLHIISFPNFFLTQLGMGFLVTLYSGYVQDESSGIIVAETASEKYVVGFIAYSENYSEFYRNLLKTHILRFAIYSLGAVIRHPSYAKRLLGAFRKSDEVKRKEKYVELASIGVLPKQADKGIGSRLIRYLIDSTDFEKFAYINLETDAIDNVKANSFYYKNGFRLVREYETSEGRRMNEYHFVKDKDEEDFVH